MNSRARAEASFETSYGQWYTKLLNFFTLFKVQIWICCSEDRQPDRPTDNKSWSHNLRSEEYVFFYFYSYQRRQHNTTWRKPLLQISWNSCEIVFLSSTYLHNDFYFHIALCNYFSHLLGIMGENKLSLIFILRRKMRSSIRLAVLRGRARVGCEGLFLLFSSVIQRYFISARLFVQSTVHTKTHSKTHLLARTHKITCNTV